MTYSGIPSARPPPPGPCPWLVYYHGRGYKNQTFCSHITGPMPIQTYCKTIPALHDKTVLSCSYGWLVLYNDESKVFCLCNCSTFDTIDLPGLELLTSQKDNISIDSCILSSSPNSPDCKVLLFLENFQSIMYCRLRDKEWCEIKYGKQLTRLDREITNPSDINGTLYFCQPVICRGKLFVNIRVNTTRYHTLFFIQIVEDEPMRVMLKYYNQPVTNRQCSGHSDSEVHVVESCGELFWLFFWPGGIMRRDNLEVEVFRLNFDTMEWERQKSIENRSFFICPNYGMSCRSSGPGLIYLTRSEDYSLYRYNMEDESLWVSLPVLNLTKPWLPPIWMMPEHIVRQEDGCQEENKARSMDLGEGPSIYKEKQLCELPLDILRKVTKHLNPPDYVNFRGVNRILRRLLPRVNWSTELPGSKTSLSIPLLMFAAKGKRLYKFVDPRINSNDGYLIRIPECLKDATIRYSNYGWLLLSRGHSVYLYNPFRKDTKRYTWTDMPENSFFFSSKPSVGSSGILISALFPDCVMDPITVRILYPGANHWRRHEFMGRSYFKPAHNSPVLFKDAYYYLSESGLLGRFKLEGHNCTWEVLEEPTGYCFHFHESFLVECGGDLLSIIVARAGRLVVVYKLDQSENAWRTVTSLNNYSVYLSPNSSFSLVASPGLENRVYLPRFRGCGIVFYSLETGKWHVAGTGDSYRHFHGTRLLLDSCWIQPTWC